MPLLNYLFPNHTCVVCKGELNSGENIYLCDACAEKLPINTEPVAIADQNATQYFDRAVAAFQYAEPVRSAILELKYNNNGLVAVAFAPYMAGAYGIGGGCTHPPVIVPVPLCKKRQKSRGYNQAEILAREIGRYLGLAVATDILTRVKATTPQKKMNVKERAENLADAFAIATKNDQRDPKYSSRVAPAPHKISGQNFIIVDDVFTTGATVNECAKVLKNAGAVSVDVLCFARTVFN